MRRRRNVSLLLLLLCLPAAAAADPVDDLVKAQMAEFNLAGLSVAVMKQGAIVKAGGYGVADRESKAPAAPDTVYKIASVSKQFVATGIMLLVADGRVRLDDPISTHLGDVPRSWGAITVRHLLAHTSGLVREPPAFSPFKNQTDDELLKSAYSTPLQFAPGEKWAYCNLGYVALAEIIARVSGQPWTQFMNARVFAPAGMTATFPTNTAEKIATRATGYGGDDNRRKIDEWIALRAGGAFLSTVLDMAKWDAVLYTDKILNEQARREMWAPIRLAGGRTAPYGLGWHVESGRHGRSVWHGGGMPGFTSHFVRFIDRGVSVIVLTNGDDADTRGIAKGIAAIYLK
jgi:D-alanyl-D-alanine carboxypeptidase